MKKYRVVLWTKLVVEGHFDYAQTEEEALQQVVHAMEAGHGLCHVSCHLSDGKVEITDKQVGEVS